MKYWKALMVVSIAGMSLVFVVLALQPDRSADVPGGTRLGAAKHQMQPGDGLIFTSGEQPNVIQFENGLEVRFKKPTGLRAGSPAEVRYQERPPLAKFEDLGVRHYQDNEVILLDSPGVYLIILIEDSWTLEDGTKASLERPFTVIVGDDWPNTVNGWPTPHGPPLSDTRGA